MILGMDTCGPVGTLALAQLDGDRICLRGEAEIAGKTYSAMLMPRIRELLDANGIGVHEITAIVVVNGPGSFTGVRVGLSAVKGLVEALGIPVIAVSRLAVLAQKGGVKFAALDAGRGEFYFGDYADGQHEALLSVEEVRSACPEREIAICEDRVALALPEARVVGAPTATDALRFGLPKLLTQDFDDAVMLDGNYLRRADAEVKMGALKR
ncbi:MAG TPA: tRNA (adenosine(37)-N6)-threonylcarbamoyltransferase complex dimerization subunit type 1 TsaB [Pseudacidobacterium sp.]|nr:tRNA (adenosine(37)-N6)-threonylcarbamoyltransferase complex dimerization subunit type 1 TsaB [Pseudacidobacterium sp.]